MACASKLDTAGTAQCVSWLRPQHAASGRLCFSFTWSHDDPGGLSQDLRSGVKIIRESFVPSNYNTKEKKEAITSFRRRLCID